MKKKKKKEKRKEKTVLKLQGVKLCWENNDNDNGGTHQQLEWVHKFQRFKVNIIWHMDWIFILETNKEKT